MLTELWGCGQWVVGAVKEAISEEEIYYSTNVFA